MRVSTFEKCVEEYRSFNGWDKDFEVMREELLERFPHSVTVEGDYFELDMAANWCVAEIGPADTASTYEHVMGNSGQSQEIAAVENGGWADQWFYKTGYDYGFMEFYFRTPADLERFVKAVPSFFGDGPTGKWRTEGYRNIVRT